jgi:hypothetical protein
VAVPSDQRSALPSFGTAAIILRRIIMKKILVVVCSVAILTVSVSCASSPVIVDQSINRSALNGTTIIAEPIMAVRETPIIPLVDAGIFAIAFDSANENRERVQERKLKSLYEDISEYYEKFFGVQTVQAAFPVAGEVGWTYFSEPAEEATKQIVSLCATNEADYFVGIIGQYVTTSVSAFGITGRTKVQFSVCIFDKTGTPLASGSVQTGVNNTGGGNYASQVTLIDEAAIYLEDLLQQMAP